jgi:sugar phosphate isomerase/epimerase
MEEFREILGFSARLKGFTWKDLTEVARELGLHYLEIVADIPWVLPGDLTREQWMDIRQTLSRAQIRPLLHASYIELNLSSPNPLLREAALKQIRECLEIALYLDSPYMVVHPGNLNRNYPKSLMDQVRTSLIQTLGELAAEAEKRGLAIGLENGWNGENHPIIGSSEDHLGIVEQVGSPALGILLDLGHANTFDEELCLYMERVRGSLVGMHLHDNNGQRDQHLPLGRGSLPQDAIEMALRLSVPVILEMNSLDDLKESLRTIQCITGNT